MIVRREHKDNWELTSVHFIVEDRERGCMNKSVEKKFPSEKSFNSGNWVDWQCIVKWKSGGVKLFVLQWKSPSV